MSEFITRKGFTNEVQRDTPIQKRNDQNIQNWLNCYKYYEEKEEFKQNTGKDFDLIISHRPTIPDLVIFNKPFNKNNCFCEANPDEINSFPRRKLFIKFDKKDKEQLKKYNLKKNKEYRLNSKKNNPNEMKIKENNNIKKEEENKDEKEKEENKIEEEEWEGEEDDDDDEDDEESEENNDNEEEEKEKEKENDSKQDEKKEDLEGEENFEEKKNNENKISSKEKINDKLKFNIPINSIFPKNNNNISNNSNQNLGFINYENCTTTSNTKKNNNTSQSKMNLNNDSSSIFDESLDGSILNNINNIIDVKSVSHSQSQYGNESFSMNNPNFLNNANNINNNIGFNNNININNNLFQNLLNQSQINNNNQFSNFTNNNPFGLIGNNPLNLYNPSLHLQNNLNLHINLLMHYTLKYWNDRGWLLTFIKEGNKTNSFTSFELFSFLNQKIIDNVKIDDYLITTENKEQQYTGGNIYISFINIFPNVFNILKEQSLKQIGLNNLLLKSNNNNFGIANANILNNLNNNNFVMNNFNNNNFNYN